MSPIVGVLHGDARRRVRELEDHSVQVVVTSVPYWGATDYTDDPDEQGRSGVPLAVWLAEVVSTFEALRPKLHPTAAVWLNVGDTAVGSGGSGGDYNAGGAREKRPRYRQGYAGLPTGGWSLAPSRLAAALQDAGWRVRADITWDRSPQYVREDVRHVKRPLRASERIYLLGPSRVRLPRFNVEAHKALPREEQGDVWHFGTAKGKGRQGRFPLMLPERCIALTAQPGDVVLDPYAGEGTTGLAAVQAGCHAALVDIDPTAVRTDRLVQAGARVLVDGWPLAGAA